MTEVDLHVRDDARRRFTPPWSDPLERLERLEREVAESMADLYAAVTLLIHLVNSLPAKDHGDVPRIDYGVEKRITEGLRKWTTRAVGGVHP